MCHKCDEFVARGTTFLDELVQTRCRSAGVAPSQNTMATARMIMESLQEMNAVDAYDEVCFALATAVERLVALDQCGLLR